MIRKIFALLKKDFFAETSYKFSFFVNVFGVFATLLTYFFIDKLFGSRVTSHLEEFGVSYFSYVLLSMAFFNYIGVGMGSFARRIRFEQLQGTLESLFLTPTRPSLIVLSMGLWNFLFATFNLMIYILLGIFLFKIDFTHVNVLSSLVILFLAIISLSSLGIISASFILVFKRGSPLEWIVSTIEGVLGGVFFPVSVMPAYLQTVAKLLPITYAVRGIELSVYRGYSLGMLKNEWGFLLIFSIILLPLSFYTFKSALKRSRRQGSLAQY